MTDEEYLIYLFREGDLVFADSATSQVETTDEQILEADKEGKLVGANGSATLFGQCPQCGWKGQEHFVIGDEEREMAYLSLEAAHGNDNPRCDDELNFRQDSR